MHRYTIWAENITYIKKLVGIYLMYRDAIHYIIEIARNLFDVAFSGVAASEL